MDDLVNSLQHKICLKVVETMIFCNSSFGIELKEQISILFIWWQRVQLFPFPVSYSDLVRF